MENKTPMQELIEYIELNQPKNKITDGIWSKAKSLLEKEKQVIEDAVDDQVNRYSGMATFRTNGKDYYNEKINFKFYLNSKTKHVK